MREISYLEVPYVPVDEKTAFIDIGLHDGHARLWTKSRGVFHQGHYAGVTGKYLRGTWCEE